MKKESKRQREESEDEGEEEFIPQIQDDSEESDSEEEDRKFEELIGKEDDEEGEDSELEFSDPESISTDARLLKDMNNINVNEEDSEYDTDTTYVEGADGKPRPIRPEIDPVYDSDDSDQEESNTIGDLPLSAYEQMPHIGYDIDGKRIMRPATGSALDNLLESIDLPEGWTGLLDKSSGKGLNLSEEELQLIKKLQKGENPDDSVDPYAPTIEWFSSKTEIMPLSAAPEPKRRFVPSKHEAKRVMKIVKAIREGRIVPNKPKEPEQIYYDVWSDNAEQKPDHIMHLRAPKLPPPTHEESYNPPEEYLLDDKEKEEWEKAHPSDRERNFLPQKYGALRKVPGYSESVRERFERSLDLYLAPRVRHKKLNIDPDSLIPELPSPKDLRPFPIKCSTVYRGHEGRVRTLSIDPTGQFLATGGDDGTVRVWEVLTGRELWKLNVLKNDAYTEEEEERDTSEDSVEVVSWNPKGGLLSVAAGENIYLIVPPVFDIDIENSARELIEAGWGYAAGGNAAQSSTNVENQQDDNGDDEDEDDDGPVEKKKTYAKWTTAAPKLADNGVGAVVRCKMTVKKLSWHRRGDYFVTVSPRAAHSAVLIHQLSKHTTQSPLRKNKGIVQDAKFHPFRPHLYVANQRYVRVYDLASQVLSRKLMPGVRWMSSFDIHPQGDNVITSSYDKRLTWHDMDLGNMPYKTLRYHEKAVRDVAYHKGGLPLFCSASDDGTIQVFHGSVYDDLMKNPLLVPLKVLRGHQVKNHLGILQLVWHPKEAWLFSAGADGTARLWTA